MAPDRASSLELQDAGTRIQLPEWALWLIQLGTSLRLQSPADIRRYGVVCMPTTRYAALFPAFGAVVEGARSHDDGLDWETLVGLGAGTSVHVCEDRPNARPKAGIVEGSRIVSGEQMLVVRCSGRGPDRSY